MFEKLKPADIPQKQYGILRKQTNTSPIVWRIEDNGVKAIVKDFSYNNFWFRNIIGRFLIWREQKAYKILEGIPGVPAFFGSIGGTSLILEEIQGVPIDTLEILKTLDENFFRELEELTEKIHERGIAHCDLKRAPNIILGNNGKPYIIDWAASISKSEFRFFPLNLIYARFIKDDLNAITKIKLKCRPETVGQEEKLRYTERSRAEKTIRAIRDWAKDFLKKIA